MAVWKAEPAVDITVLIGGIGPLDPFGGPIFDVTQHVRGGGIAIDRGRTSEFDSFQPGTCAFELRNDNRQFDPTNASSPYAAILKPNRAMLVSVTYQGTTRYLFGGYIAGWPQHQDQADKRPTVPIVAYDFLSILNRTRLSQVAFVLDESRLDVDSLSGDVPQQFTGERISTVLGLAGFSAAINTDIARGKTIMPGYSGDADLLSVERAAEAAEAGFFYVSKSATVTFLDRHARFEDLRLSTAQATFNDDEYGDIEIDYDLTRTWNDVRFAKPDSAPQTARDQTSVETYGQLTYPESGDAQTIEVISDGEAVARAQFWVDRYGTPMARPSPIVIKPRRNMPALFAKCVDRELADRIDVLRTPQGIGPEVTITGLVDSVRHEITNQDWTTTLAFSPFDVQDNTGFLVLDENPEGELDTALLAY